LAGLGILVLSTAATAQNFTNASGQIPGGSPNNASRSENVDFADYDQDGDWDCAFADGGDGGNDQNRLWTNQGLAQAGVIGNFLDVTNTQAPVFNDQSRDIEFVDFDNDSDVDIYVSNTSAISSQTNRWWANMGNLQAGTAGFYQDQTNSRWTGLGVSGSSINPSQILGSGGFIDFSCDCDFGDLDNDGDLDLVHSSYGGVFGGQVPTRLFLNSGAGVFSEFNPLNYQLGGQTINNGEGGVWCEGTQSSNTTNSTGVNCDIASSALDIDVGDIDGDLDLDILHGARQELPRMFRNNCEENGVFSQFRDITGAVFPAGYSTGNGHYDQQLSDLDDDGDLDIYGMNWQVSGSLNDITLKNLTGNGVYGSTTVVPGSGSDDNETDSIDYDGDGDLDVFIANFSGQDRLYRNSTGTGTLVLTSGVLPADNSTSLDADMGDIDNDGDYDIMVANDSNQANVLLKNNFNVADTHAPKLYRLEQAPNRFAGVAPTVIRVQVYDNTSYYTTWYYDTRLEVQVNGGAVTVYPMLASQGQIFRAALPGNLVGTITYRALSTDKSGNTGSTPILQYTGSNGGHVGTDFCVPGADIGTLCPCSGAGQIASAGHGCGNSVFTGGALLEAIGTISPDTVQLTTSDVPAGVGTIYLQGSVNLVGGTGPVAFGDGIRCAGGALTRLGLRNDTDNDSVTTYGPLTKDIPVSIRGAVTLGNTYVYQTYYRNPNAAWCPAQTFNVTQAIAITW